MPAPPDLLELVVAARAPQAEGVAWLELRDPRGAPLPPFTPGAHIDLYLPGGLVRQYSLCNDSEERDRYCLGVGLAPDSRGGSRYVHFALQSGARVAVGYPRARFGLAPEAGRHRFIAGGIGITPFLSMIHWCERHGADWELLYCVRSRGRAGWREALLGHGARARLHADDEHGGPADILAWLDGQRPGDHVYCCGPGPLMDAVADAAGRLGMARGSVHFERFAAPGETVRQGDRAFTIGLRRSGLELQVPADASMLDAVEAAGIATPSSCREGLCRSCEVTLLAGIADHRDYVLSDEERAAQRSVMLCVSRACTERLELDL